MPIGADITPQYTEEAVGGGHPTKARVVSRDFIAEHHVDGKHKADKLPIQANCRLVRTNATTLTLQRFNGKSVPLIDGSGNLYFLQLASEPTLANTGLAASTLYYIYAYDNAGTITLEASATAYAAHASGLRAKSGDNTRTLVGLIRTEGSTPGQFVDSTTQRFVRSWFNDPPLALTAAFTAARTTASTSYVELNSEIRVEFLVFTGEIIVLSFAGRQRNNTAGQDNQTSIGIDDATPEDVVSGMDASDANFFNAIAGTLPKDGLAEGYHYATLVGKVGGGTGTWEGAPSGPVRVTLKGFLPGRG